MTHRYWPLFDLRLVAPGPDLRPMTEADLAAVADRLPDDGLPRAARGLCGASCPSRAGSAPRAAGASPS